MAEHVSLEGAGTGEALLADLALMFLLRAGRRLRVELRHHRGLLLGVVSVENGTRHRTGRHGVFGLGTVVGDGRSGYGSVNGASVGTRVIVV